ncbi:MAG TPA: energy transducer TonB [Cytophagaceae bacterium]|jgi:protein TonB|nr:energy transducer TonB [Cytophagaceae bacterium]
MKKVIFIIIALISTMTIESANAQNPSKSIPAAQYYEGGQVEMYKFIDANKIYPINAKKSRTQGECIIHVVIEADGKTSAATIVSNIGGGCGAEALRVVKLLKFRAPGYKVDANIPVYFKL